MYNLLSLPKLVSARVTVDKVKNFSPSTIKSSRLNIILYIRNCTAEFWKSMCDRKKVKVIFEERYI